jgi:kynurenine formamidase
VFDADPKTSFNRYHTISAFGYNILQLQMSSHIGTHADAPYHFLEDGKKIANVDLDKFVGNASILNFQDKKDGDYIDVADLEKYKDKFVAGGKVLLRTDWGKNYPGDVFFKSFPQLTIAASQWIAETGIELLGLETPSVNATDFAEIHRILLGKEIVILEGLTNLKEIPGDQAFIVALPLKIREGDGSPIRAVAIIDF